MTLRSFGFAFALLGAFVAGTLVPTASVQSAAAPKRFIQLQYMKVKPGQGAAYRQIERDLWRPVHQERVKRGLINSWAMYGVHLPGAAADYDFVVLTEWPSFAGLENSQYAELFSEVQEMDDYEGVLQRTRSTRTLVKQDIWVLVDHVE